MEGGRVHIRDWRDRKSSRADTKRKPVAPGALKTRPCWFHGRHPQGCPLQAEDCAFAHGADDLRPSTRPLKKMKNDASWLDQWNTVAINKTQHPLGASVDDDHAVRAPHVHSCCHAQRGTFSVQAERVLLMRRYIISGNWGLEISQCPLPLLSLCSVWDLTVRLPGAEWRFHCWSSLPPPGYLLEFNFKGSFCLYIYFSKKWTSVKFRFPHTVFQMDFKQYLCIYLKIMK